MQRLAGQGPAVRGLQISGSKRRARFNYSEGVKAKPVHRILNPAGKTPRVSALFSLMGLLQS